MSPAPPGVLAKGTAGNFGAKIYTSDAANTNLKPFDAPVTISPGSAQQPLSLPVSLSGPVSTIQPSLTLNFIICLLGLYPRPALIRPPCLRTVPDILRKEGNHG